MSGPVLGASRLSAWFGLVGAAGSASLQRARHDHRPGGAPGRARRHRDGPARRGDPRRSCTCRATTSIRLPRRAARPHPDRRPRRAGDGRARALPARRRRDRPGRRARGCAPSTAPSPVDWSLTERVEHDLTTRRVRRVLSVPPPRRRLRRRGGVSGVSLTRGAGRGARGRRAQRRRQDLAAAGARRPRARGARHVEVDGADVTQWFPHLRAAARRRVRPRRRRRAADADRAREPASSPGPTTRRHRRRARPLPGPASRALDTAAGNLSGGEQQVLAFAQALLRRPCACCWSTSCRSGCRRRRSTPVLAAAGRAGGAPATAVVLVEQSISTAMAIADTALFLESGQRALPGTGARRCATTRSCSPSSRSAPAARRPWRRFGARPGPARCSGPNARPCSQSTDVTAAYGDVARRRRRVASTSAPAKSSASSARTAPGKTSLFDCLSGDAAARRRHGHAARRPTSPTLAPHRRAERGLMRSFQSVRLFPSLTVRDCIAVALETRLNVKSAAFAGLWLPPARAEERRVDERVDVLLELLRPRGASRGRAGRRRCRSARAGWSTWRASSRPGRRCCCSTSRRRGLAHGEIELLGPLVSRISSDLDCAVLIIEHNVQVLASVAHRLIAMRAGAVIADGAPADVLADPAVRAAYFGAAPPPGTRPPHEPPRKEPTKKMATTTRALRSNSRSRRAMTRAAFPGRVRAHRRERLARHQGQGVGAPARAHRDGRRRPLPARGHARHGQDDDGAGAVDVDRRARRTASSARPTCCRPT